MGHINWIRDITPDTPFFFKIWPEGGGGGNLEWYPLISPERYVYVVYKKRGHVHTINSVYFFRGGERKCPSPTIFMDFWPPQPENLFQNIEKNTKCNTPMKFPVPRKKKHTTCAFWWKNGSEFGFCLIELQIFCIFMLFSNKTALVLKTAQK